MGIQEKKYLLLPGNRAGKNSQVRFFFASSLRLLFVFCFGGVFWVIFWFSVGRSSSVRKSGGGHLGRRVCTGVWKERFTGC